MPVRTGSWKAYKIQEDNFNLIMFHGGRLINYSLTISFHPLFSGIQTFIFSTFLLWIKLLCLLLNCLWFLWINKWVIPHCSVICPGSTLAVPIPTRRLNITLTSCSLGLSTVNYIYISLVLLFTFLIL